MFYVHNVVYNLQEEKDNRTKEKASNQEKELKDLNVSTQAYAEI